MLEEILVGHDHLSGTQSSVAGLIAQIRGTQQQLQRVDDSLSSSWYGDGQGAFSSLSKENHAMLTSLIAQMENLNNGITAANRVFETTDTTQADNLGRDEYE
jgi:WXG100 family type VII secretion target